MPPNAARFGIDRHPRIMAGTISQGYGALPSPSVDSPNLLSATVQIAKILLVITLDKEQFSHSWCRAFLK
jgi:hypothetical protein